MKLYAAIDLHSNNNVLAVIDEQDRVLFDRRLPNDLAADFGDRDRSFRSIVTDQSGRLCWGGIVDPSVTMGRS